MAARLVILVVLAGVLAVYAATRPPVVVEKQAKFVSADPDQNPDTVRMRQKTLEDRPLLGEEPPEPVAVDIRVEVDPSGKKNRLYYYVDEIHGYYVERLQMEFWYKPTPDTTPEDSPLVVPAWVEDYVKANETFASCLEVVPAELRYIGGDIGRSEDWEGRLVSYGRARKENPAEFKQVARPSSCD